MADLMNEIVLKKTGIDVSSCPNRQGIKFNRIFSVLNDRMAVTRLSSPSLSKSKNLYFLITPSTPCDDILKNEINPALIALLYKTQRNPLF